MKKIGLFLMSISCLTFSLARSQVKLLGKDHNYRHGDYIVKQRVDYIEPNTSGQGVVWDFAALKTSKEHYLIKYFNINENDTSSFCGLEHDTRYYYHRQEDSIWATGFENHTTFLKYTEPELRMKFPFTYGDSLSSNWEGEGLYSNLFHFKIRGHTRVFADAEGQLVLPEAHVIDSVLRVHTTRYYEETGKDSLRMTLDVYSWYSPIIPYPVFESIKTILHQNNNDTIISDISFYYLPQKTENLHEDKNPKDSTMTGRSSEMNTSSFELPLALNGFTRPENSQKNSQASDNPKLDDFIADVFMAPNPVKNDLTVKYKLLRGASVYLTLYNMGGSPVWKSPRRKLREGHYTEIIPMGHLMTGTYVMHVSIDHLAFSRIIIKH